MYIDCSLLYPCSSPPPLPRSLQSRHHGTRENGSDVNAAAYARTPAVQCLDSEPYRIVEEVAACTWGLGLHLPTMCVVYYFLIFLHLPSVLFHFIFSRSYICSSFIFRFVSFSFFNVCLNFPPDNLSFTSSLFVYWFVLLPLLVYIIFFSFILSPLCFFVAYSLA
jgi:hypothetical protein